MRPELEYIEEPPRSSPRAIHSAISRDRWHFIRSVQLTPYNDGFYVEKSIYPADVGTWVPSHIAGHSWGNMDSRECHLILAEVKIGC
jgi:hypothetical protein